MQTIMPLWKVRMALIVAMLLLHFAAISAASQHDETKPSAAEVKQEVAKTYESLQKYTLEQKDEAIAAADRKLEALDAKIDQMQGQLDSRWQNMSKATRQKTRDMMNKLNKEREKVAEWYGGMRHSSADAWEEVKKGFADSYDQLQQAFAEARKDFDKHD